MKTKFFNIIFFVMIFLSYCRQKKELRAALTSDCYWDILDKASIHPVNSCYKFREDGSCNFYYYNFFDKKKTNSVFLYDDDDVIVPDKWEVAKDSIMIRANKYLVIKWDADSVFLTRTGTDSLVLIKNCATYNSKD